MWNKDIVVKLTPADQEMIAHALLESAQKGVVVHVMIQEDGLKFKIDWGIWTPPVGKVQR